MSDDAEIRRQNLRRLKLKPGELAAKLDGRVSFWSDLLKQGSTKSFGEKLARSIEDGLGFPRGALDIPGEAHALRRTPGLDVLGGDADPLLYEITDPKSVSVTWEWLVKTAEIPRLFVVKMPDGALAGHIDEGDELVFERDRSPEVGRAVLIETGEGKRFIRLYAEGRGDHWRAIAGNVAYMSFDSSIEDIKVVAGLRWRT